MVQRKTFLMWWIGGLIAFAIVIAMSLPLGITEVPGGIADHQAAGDAATVNAIHAAWTEAGVMEQARYSMIGDLVFIGIYGIGATLGGLYYRAAGTGFLRHLGTVIAIAGAVFLLTDYGETIAQFIQASANAGSDELAGFAATVRPPKMIAFMVSFLGVLLALALEWKQRRGLQSEA
ncbi:hypothetical protein [Pontixanthobacter aquaemixtae]|uniref:Uncharacterized protein n=1 Tax=Pontixanthobacter aquaemixtae TaxID=1958940 RepID=A0A844ZRM5_9SPHN|nr:hypothetical protein [Pontixanthobacter aquaemixtae]MXO90503.1 hypothetical protein [Pontixanthobacter aquaemixtae]